MEKALKREFVFDTSALLSLASIGILGKVSEIAIILVTPSVIKELQDFAKHLDSLGIFAGEILEKQGIFVKAEEKINETLPHLERTDNILFNLAYNLQIPLITDDIKFARVVGRRVEVLFSTFFLSSLVQVDLISKREALSLLERVRTLRNWEWNLIYLSTKSALELI